MRETEQHRSRTGKRLGCPALALVLAAGLATLGASTATASHSLIDLVSVGPGGGNVTNAFFAGASDDGRLVFFATEDALVPEDADGLCYRGFDYYTGPIYEPCVDVYEHDRITGTTRLLSTGPNGNRSYDAKFAGATPDGSHVFIETGEPLVSEDADFGCVSQPYGAEEGCPDLYEVSGGETMLVSTGPTDQHGTNEVSYNSRFLVSADGSRVYFMTTEPLVAADADGCSGYAFDDCRDAYMRSGGSTTLISQGPGDSHQFASAGSRPVGDGRLAFFASRENLAPEDTDHCAGISQQGPCLDVYLRNLETNTTALVSTGPHANQDLYAASYGGEPTAITPDARYVFFRTAEPITDDDVEGNQSSCAHDGLGDVGCNDIYRRDLQTDTTTLISTGPKKIGPGGTNTTQDAEFKYATPDGQRAFFVTEEQLVEADADGQADIYEWSNGTTRLISTSPNPPSGAHEARFLAASRDGDRVFITSSERLTANDLDFVTDIYRKAGNTLELVSVGPTGGNAEVHVNQFGQLSEPSPDGSRILFSTAESLVPEDSDTAIDAYEWHEGTTSLLLQGVETPSDLLVAGQTPDIRHVFFSTNDALAGNDGDTTHDVYAATLNQPPDCQAVAPDRAVLQRPNRGFRTVRIVGATDPDQDAVTLEITGVTQDEPVGSRPDARSGSSPDRVQLRAEPDRRGDGRVYRISFAASDGTSECSGETTVEVRRKKNRPAVDSAPPSYDSFVAF